MRKIPDDIQPFKNQWLSAGKIKQLFCFEKTAFSTWFEATKSRIRYVNTDNKARPGEYSKKYLVKNVWAAACAHGLTLRLSDNATPQQEIASLKTELAALEAREKSLVGTIQELKSWGAPREPDLTVSMYKRILFATEPRPVQGVYFLLRGEEIVYVGQSGNVLSRMAGHQNKDFDLVRMIQTYGDKERTFLETSMIRSFRPEYNVKGITV